MDFQAEQIQSAATRNRAAKAVERYSARIKDNQAIMDFEQAREHSMVVLQSAINDNLAKLQNNLQCLRALNLEGYADEYLQEILKIYAEFDGAFANYIPQENPAFAAQAAPTDPDLQGYAGNIDLLLYQTGYEVNFENIPDAVIGGIRRACARQTRYIFEYVDGSEGSRYKLIESKPDQVVVDYDIAEFLQEVCKTNFFTYNGKPANL